jgi:TetR/AcrR family transcriptional regulator, cholesterol catabolism regulator
MGEATIKLPRRERNKLEKRARLIAAARSLFSRKGFAATTTAEIAQRAGVGAGTLFLYFSSKDDLLVAIFREQMDAVVDAAFATLPRRATLLDEIVHVYGAMIEFHEGDPELARAFVKELLFVGEPNRDSVFAFIDGLDERIAGRIEARQARGELDAAAPALLVAENCFALFIARLQKWLGLDGRLASEEHIVRLREAFALQLRGLERPRAKPTQAKGG